MLLGSSARKTKLVTKSARREQPFTEIIVLVWQALLTFFLFLRFFFSTSAPCLCFVFKSYLQHGHITNQSLNLYKYTVLFLIFLFHSIPFPPSLLNCYYISSSPFAFFLFTVQTSFLSYCV